MESHTQHKEQAEVEKLLKELSIQETNMPNVPKRDLRYQSFGGRIRIAALVDASAPQFIGKIITVGGWARSVRLADGGNIAFVELNDGSSIKNFQIVVQKGINGFDDLCKEGIGSCFLFKGDCVKSPGNKQPIELLVSDNEKHLAKITGPCDQSKYPLFKSKTKMKLENLREICHLRPRTNTISCVARIRNSLAYATHLFFQNRGFLYVHTPIITGSDCEGAGEMFQVTTMLPKPHEKFDKIPLKKDGTIEYSHDFFGKPTFLTVSGQLAVENYACALSDVYTFGPTFRAENSHTTRHLAEFWMIEPEMCFADIHDDMECAENYLKFCLKYVLENNMDDLLFIDAQIEKGIIERLRNVTENEFKKLSYTEGIEILKAAVEKDKNLFKEEVKKVKKEKKPKEAKDGHKDNAEPNATANTTCEAKTEEKKEEHKTEEKPKPVLDKRNIYWGMDMASEHERYLTEEVFKKPIIVFNYPAEIKSFYMRLNEDGKTVAAMDILVPKIGEIIGGSQREERYDVLIKKIEELKLDVSSYWWYLELRKYGSVPHCGFGLGFERLVMMATGLENIRDVIPYPRYPGHSEY